MAEPSFVALYTREFLNLAGRDPEGPGFEESLARKVGETRTHAALMDARKGGDHLEAVASALEIRAVEAPTQGHRSQTPEEWDMRVRLLRRSILLLREEGREAPLELSGRARLALRT